MTSSLRSSLAVLALALCTLALCALAPAALAKPRPAIGWDREPAATAPATTATATSTAPAMPAGPPAAVTALIERYLQVTGGRAAFEAETTFRAKGRLVSGGQAGTIEYWLRPPDAMAARMTLGTLKVRTGCRGGTAWRTDLTSKRVTLLDGKDLEKARADAWFENANWARVDHGGATLRAAGVSFMGGHERHAIEVVPPVGRSRTLWFDGKTGLLDRVHEEEDNDSSEDWMTDYRSVAGRKRSMATRPMTADAYAGEEGVTIDSVWVNVALPDGLFDPPASKAEPVVWLKTRGTAQVPFLYSGRSIWVRASINGAPPADFLLDTGCSMTALDRDWASGLGLVPEGSSQVQGIGATAQSSFATVKRLRIAAPGATGDGVEVRGLKVTLVDLGRGMEAVHWRRAAGLIGYDLISHFVLEVDYDKGVLTFRDPATFAYAGGGAVLPMGLAGGVPTVEVAVGRECSGTFFVDTGNSMDLAIHDVMVKRCGLARVQRKELKLYAGGIGGSFPEWLGRLDSVRIGPYSWREPLAGMSLHRRGMVGSEDYSGNVGNSVLERFRCTFDYARRQLYLEPGARYERRDTYSRLGATLVRFDDKVYAVGIVSDSPADSAGFEWMDEVKTVDGRPVLRYTRDELDQLLIEGPAGSTHHVVVTRDFKDHDLEVVLRDVI
jgi:hypothetical protein